MKRIIILLLALMPVIACVQQKPKGKVIVNGDRGVYAVLDSTLYLATNDTLEFAVKLYEEREGLFLESPKPLYGNLFGIKSKTGYRDRLKWQFDFLGKTNEGIYLYGIHSSDLPQYMGKYYLLNLEYCWVYYQYEDFSNKPDMIEFSPAEFDRFFSSTKAYIMNY
jgi:hypothetical protein